MTEHQATEPAVKYRADQQAQDRADAIESRDARIEALEAEVRDLEATLDFLGERVTYYRDSEVPGLRLNVDGWAARAEKAESTIRRIEALVEGWAIVTEQMVNKHDREVVTTVLDDLREKLAISKEATR